MGCTRVRNKASRAPGDDDLGDRLAENPPAGAEILVGDDGPNDAHLLYRPNWQGDDGRPIAAVGIGWSPKSVDFTQGKCWIGNWRGQREAGDPLIDVLRSSLTEIAAELNLTKRGDPQWPLYRYGPGPSGDFWDDLRPWFDELENAVRTVWARTADEIGRILRGPSSTSAFG